MKSTFQQTKLTETKQFLDKFIQTDPKEKNCYEINFSTFPW